MAYQVAAVYEEMWDVRTSQLYRAVTSTPTKASITAIKVNIRVMT